MHIIEVEAMTEGGSNDTWYSSSVNSISVSSGVNTSSISAHSPSDMFMRHSTPVQYDNIKNCDKLDKKNR